MVEEEGIVMVAVGITAVMVMVLMDGAIIMEEEEEEEGTFLPKKLESVLHYYKNPKPSKNKVHILYPSSNTLKL